MLHTMVSPTGQSHLAKKVTQDSTHTNFPIGHCPRVSHPIRNIGPYTPCSFRRRNRIKVGIRSTRSRCKAAGLLINGQRKATTPDWPGLAYAGGGCVAIDRDSTNFVVLECHDEKSRSHKNQCVGGVPLRWGRGHLIHKEGYSGTHRRRGREGTKCLHAPRGDRHFLRTACVSLSWLD